ncbi:MAG TPA: hypothetical protein VFZ81_09160 [Burkholderiales bacterium]|jgi:hypothetical protein
MPITNLEAARRHHKALKQFFASRTGEAADLRALRHVLTLCDAASAAVDDDYCREKLRVVGEYAAEMLGHGDRARWGRDPASGAEFLRQQVLNALELLASRLYSLEALRRATEKKGTPQWTTRSSIALI